MSRRRPISVALIAVLKIVDGILGLASGCMLTIGGGALAVILAQLGQEAPAWLSGLLGGLAAGVGLTLIVFALLDFVLAWGVWKLARWAWWLTMIAGVVSIIGPLITLAGGNVTSIPSLIINGIVILLLLTESTRRTMGITSKNA